MNPNSKNNAALIPINVWSPDSRIGSSDYTSMVSGRGGLCCSLEVVGLLRVVYTEELGFAVKLIYLIAPSANKPYLIWELLVSYKGPGPKQTLTNLEYT